QRAAWRLSAQPEGCRQRADPRSAVQHSGQLACDQREQQRWRCTRRGASWRGAVTSPANPLPPSAPPPRSGWWRLARVVLYGFLALVVLVGIAYWYVNTASFANYVRGKLID